MFFITLAGLGYPVVSILKYPEFLILKEISLLGIIERVENIVSMYFIFSMIITIMVCVYYAFNNLNNYSKNKIYKKSLVYILPLLVLFISLICFKNITVSTTFNLTYLPLIIGIGAIGTHLIIAIRLLIHNILNKKLNKKIYDKKLQS